MLGNCHAKLDGKALRCDICNLEFHTYREQTAQCPRAKSLAAGGHKDDGDKVRMELIPPELMVAAGSILTFGAKKYDDRNWEKGMAWSRVFGALMRHMWAWWGGKGSTSTNFIFGDLDEETKFSHLWHAVFCIAVLVTYEMRGIGEDDRWKGPTGGPRA